MSSVEELLKLAQDNLSQGNQDRAFAICREIISQQPNCAIAYQLLGNIQEDNGQLIAAMGAYTKAFELAPNQPISYAYLAQVYRNMGWFDEAISFYQQAIDLSPNWADLHYHLGMTWHWQGNIEGAIGCYQKAIALNPKLGEAYLDMALRLNERGDINTAIKVLQEGRINCPNFKEIFNTMGYLQLQQNQIDEAIAIFQEALSIDPTEPLVYNNLGWAFARQGKLSEAIAAYHKAISLKPDLAIAYSNLGKLWQHKNNHRQAITYFQKAIAIEPDNIMFYSDCGNSCLIIGCLSQAMACFQKAIAIDPKFVQGYIQRFNRDVILETGSDELLQAQIACAQFLEALQKSDLELGNSENSQESDHSVTEVPDAVYNYLEATYSHLGNTLNQYGEWDAAIRYYQRALRIKPQKIQTYLDLASCLAKQGRLQGAITVCHTAGVIEYSPEVYWLLGSLLELQGQWELAIAYYSKVLQNGGTAENLTTVSQEWRDSGTISTGEIPRPQQPPQGVYQKTQAWLQANNIDTSHYIPIPTVGQQLPPTELDLDNVGGECGGLDCSPCRERIFAGFEVSNLGYGIERRVADAKTVEVPFETFVASIPQGRCWIVPQENNWKVCRAIATITPDHQLLADLSREYPAPLPGCTNYNPQQHWIFRQTKLCPPQNIDGTVAVLSGLSGHIYFHWMVDILPRWELMRRVGIDFNQIDGFVVNSALLPFQRETLRRLGIAESKIIESDRYPHIQARQLLVPSFASPTGWLQPWGVDFLRGTFLPLATGDNHDYPNRIYVSRAQARHRRVLNEEQVMARLSRLGFVRVLPEKLSFSQQVALFSRAEIVIGPHGSGLTNLIFCQPGVRVIEFISPHYDRHYYWVISQALGLEHYSLTGDGFSCYPLRSLMYQNPLTEDIWVNMTGLEKILEKLEIR
ncbi:MAG: tetratricopeptide repeat protein [Arthrospira sp. PLM2.Bin9]|nr:tetratricopeptide repeat protein [Arthrospira sp. PLM2.Bin9]TVU52628.1 MAG: tetratricopeptide repeat protein [Arthrospira sp. PLM2.Bin9]